MPEELSKLMTAGTTAEDQEEVKEEQFDATIHYDKEDLISFHQLFISKPLAKAAQELDYEHPTVI